MTAIRPLRIAINGFGRIGRCLLRAIHEAGLRDDVRIVAINEPSEPESIAYLTRFDSTHGRFPGRVELKSGVLCIDGRAIALTHARTPEAVAWGDLGLDLLVECSGQYPTRTELARFLAAGCPRILLSQPGHSAEDVDATVVWGLNHRELTGNERVVSNASCTTNAIVPVMHLLDRAFGLEHAMLTTLHSLMNDQPILDGFHHADLRCTRSALQSMIPVSTGLARGVQRLMPHLVGRVQAKAIRVPTLNVSAIDLVGTLKTDVDAAALNRLFAEAAAGEWADVLAYSDDPHASIDFNHHPQSAILDGCQTRVSGGHLVNLMVWFDNEWGYACRLLDVARYWGQCFE